jgi:DNA-binding XRE family transcriptional regulator
MQGIKIKDKSLSEKMIKNGYTGQSLADEIGVTRQAISKILNGVQVSPKLAKMLCDVFESEFDDFFMIVGD